MPVILPSGDRDWRIATSSRPEWPTLRSKILYHPGLQRDTLSHSNETQTTTIKKKAEGERFKANAKDICACVCIHVC